MKSESVKPSPSVYLIKLTNGKKHKKLPEAKRSCEVTVQKMKSIDLKVTYYANF